MASKSQRKKLCNEVLDLIILCLPSAWSHCQIPQQQQSLTEEESQSPGADSKPQWNRSMSSPLIQFLVNAVNFRLPNGKYIFIHFKLSSLSFSWEMGQLGNPRGLIFCTYLYFSTHIYTCQDIHCALMLRQRKHHSSVSQMGYSKTRSVGTFLLSSYNNIKGRIGSGFHWERALANE